MYLEWNLDMEEGADLYDPVGKIKILGDKGIIGEEYTYLDAFFEAFVEGVERMEVEDVAKINPIVEPNDIVFICKGSLIEVKYGFQKATIFNKFQFLAELQNAVAEFLDRLDEFANNSKQQNRKLTKLRNFLLKKA